MSYVIENDAKGHKYHVSKMLKMDYPQFTYL